LRIGCGEEYLGLRGKRSQRSGKKLHNEELNDMYSSPNITQVIKSRRMGWTVHLACMGRGEVHTGLWWGHQKERDHLKDPGVEGKIIRR
jgi:hypothetical protein